MADDETGDGTPTLESNEDWETTCLIYEGDSLVKTKFETFMSRSDECTVLLAEQGGKGETKETDFPISIATMEMPLLATQTAIFAQPEMLHPHQYRFWSLQNQEKEPPPSLRITFWYKSTADEEEEEGFPSAVFVSLASDYPLTFPADDRDLWIKWLNQRASETLTEQLTSYAVCDFMDHYALDYFEMIQLNEGGYTLVVFPKPATWHGTHSVDSIVLDPLSVTHDSLFMRHYSDGTRMSTTKAALWPGATKKGRSSNSSYPWLHPCILDYDKWYKRECPICYDDYLSEDMAGLDCGHYVCKDCFSMYASVQVSVIQQYRRENPFRCPVMDCRQDVKIMATVKKYISAQEMDRVREWIKDLKHPVSKIFPHCVDCGTEDVMRQKEIDGFLVYCDNCKVKRCEYCICRIKDESIDHLSTKCNGAATLKFARRYLRASPEIREKCESKFSWIATYAEARVQSVLAIKEWLGQEEGQVCPTCSHGVVREVGCFHIHCQCGAHFCYECGEELFPPFYGTHHCWEIR